MLTFIFGVPGSGKTVYAVEKIDKVSKLEDVELKDVEVVYTNISGFKFEKFEDSKVSFQKLNFKSLHLHLKLLYALYQSNESNDNLDDILIEYCKEHKIFNAFFVIDECHHYFEGQDKVLMWWLTYHRHLHHHLLFLTQNKALINAKYRNIPELYVQAQPRSKAISSKTLRYYHYTGFAMTEKTKFNTSTINITPELMSIYKSGNVSNQKQVGKKFFFILGASIVFLLLMVAFFYYFFFVRGMFSSTIKNEETNPTVQTVSTAPDRNVIDNPAALENTTDNKNLLNTDLEEYELISILCSPTYKYCLYNNKKFGIDFYYGMKKNFNFKEISVSKFNSKFYYLNVFVTKQFKEFFKGADNEKDINSNNNIADNYNMGK